MVISPSIVQTHCPHSHPVLKDWEPPFYPTDCQRATLCGANGAEGKRDPINCGMENSSSAKIVKFCECRTLPHSDS